MTKALCIGLIPLLFLGCSKDDGPPNYPNEPYIEFVDAFIDYSDEGLQDSLVVKIRYQDGDGDLGLTSSEQNYLPYHEATYFNRNSPYEAVYDLENFEGDLLKFGDKPGGLDTLPAYNCIDYKIVTRPKYSSSYLDTVYRIINEDYYNFLMDIFLQGDTGFEYFDLFKETCVPVWGRFTPETKSGFPFVIDKESPWDGTITYVFIGRNLNQLFKNSDAIKLEIRIKDRALNKSNMVESHNIFLK